MRATLSILTGDPASAGDAADLFTQRAFEASRFADGPRSPRVRVLGGVPFERGRYAVADPTKVFAPDVAAVSVFGGVLEVVQLFDVALGRRVLHDEHLTVVPRAGAGARASYDRDGRTLRFFSFGSTRRGRRRHTDLAPPVVAHTAALAVLDAIAPDLYDATAPASQAIRQTVGHLVAWLLAPDPDEAPARVVPAAVGELPRVEVPWHVPGGVGLGSLAWFAEAGSGPHARQLAEIVALSTLDPRSPQAVTPEDVPGLAGALARALIAALGGLRGQDDALLHQLLLRPLDDLPPGELDLPAFGDLLLGSAAASAHPEHRAALFAALAGMGIYGPAPQEPRSIERSARPGLDLERLIDDDAFARAFVDSERALFGVPADAEFVVYPRRHRDRIDVSVRVGWGSSLFEPVGPGFPAQLAVRRGSTVVFGGAVPRVVRRVRAAHDASPGARSAHLRAITLGGQLHRAGGGVEPGVDGDTLTVRHTGRADLLQAEGAEARVTVLGDEPTTMVAGQLWTEERLVRAALFVDGPASDRVVVETGAAPVPWLPGAPGRYAVGGTDKIYAPDFMAVHVFGVVVSALAAFARADAMGGLRWAFPGPLRIRPRGDATLNAWYERAAHALVFGAAPNPKAPRHPIYTALSHDIVAHEAAHAILDGLAPDLYDALTPQSMGIHECVGDLTAAVAALSGTAVGVLAPNTRAPVIAARVGGALDPALAARGLRNLDDDSRLPDVDPLSPHALGGVLAGALYRVVRDTHHGLGDADLAAAFARDVLGPLAWLPPGELRFIDLARTLAQAHAVYYGGDDRFRQALEAELDRRGVPLDDGLGAARDVALPGGVDGPRLLRDAAYARARVQAWRGVLELPDGPLRVRSAVGVGTRWIRLRVGWELTEPTGLVDPPRLTVRGGCTLIIEPAGGVARLVLRGTPEAAAADRRAMLEHLIGTGQVVVGDARNRVIDGSLRAADLGRLLHRTRGQTRVARTRNVLVPPGR